MSFAALMLAALIIEAAFGWPKWLHARIAHPVIWLGALITLLDRALNRESWPHAVRYLFGAICALAVVALAAASGWLIAAATPPNTLGSAMDAVIASSLVASRSLYDHVHAVFASLAVGDIAGARRAVSMIVGRDPALLDEAGIARAALESLAENASDGVVAPVFWGVVFGLPGLAAYKAINTLDSMIGHRTLRHSAFGGFAARLDDVANLIPARLTGGLFALASLKPHVFRVMLRDAGQHRSPNAGWPESAMAGALGVRLSGPRAYAGHVANEPWLNAGAPDPDAATLRSGLRLYVMAMALMAVILAGMTFWL